MDAVKLYQDLVQLNERLRSAHQRLKPLAANNPYAEQLRRSLTTPGKKIPEVLTLIREGKLEQADEAMPDVYAVNDLLIKADQLIREQGQPTQQGQRTSEPTRTQPVQTSDYPYGNTDGQPAPTQAPEGSPRQQRNTDAPTRAQSVDTDALNRALREAGLDINHVVSAARKAASIDKFTAKTRAPKDHLSGVKAKWRNRGTAQPAPSH